MKIIGISGKSGSGKTTLANEFKKHEVLDIDVDKISRMFYTNNDIMEQTINYLQEKYQTDINDKYTFFENLAYSRKYSKCIEDPLYIAIEKEIDRIVQEANFNKIKYLLIDWAILPKTKYFSLCDYKILLISADNEMRRQKVIERDNLETVRGLNIRDAYSLNFRDYRFDIIFTNTYDMQLFIRLVEETISLLK